LNNTGHFKVYKLDSVTGFDAEPIATEAQAYYEVSLLLGESAIQFAGQEIQLKKQALVFSSPDTTERWAHLNSVRQGYSCIFDEALFDQYENVAKYSVFRPEGNQVFELTDQQVDVLNKIFGRMLNDNESEYNGKNDKSRSGVSELIHFALRMVPTTVAVRQPIKASQRIFALFMELIEVQFPIDYNYNCMRLRSPLAFAERLNLHVRHLNKVVKEVADKTTSQVIRERTMEEAKMLLRQTEWTVTEIAFALGFAEAKHFSVFFKKHVQVTPLKFRETVIELNPLADLVNQS